MLSNAGGKSADLTDTQELTRDTGSLVSRKIWLPKGLYDALPYFYLVAGAGAFLATLYISNWLWVLPHYLLFSAACLHLGVLVLRRRRRPRQHEERSETDSG
jgi:Flp pilus assembly protein TadB